MLDMKVGWSSGNFIRLIEVSRGLLIAFCIQAYWGGQALRVCIGAIIPGFAHWDKTLAGGSLFAKDLVSIFIYYAFFLTIMYIPPEHLQKPFIISATLFGSTLIGLLAWGTSQAHGVGPLFKQKETAPSVGWAIMFGMMSILGSWGGGTLGQSDWTRYSKTPYGELFTPHLRAE